jgi:hypothetical protein
MAIRSLKIRFCEPSRANLPPDNPKRTLFASPFESHGRAVSLRVGLTVEHTVSLPVTRESATVIPTFHQGPGVNSQRTGTRILRSCAAFPPAVVGEGVSQGIKCGWEGRLATTHGRPPARRDRRATRSNWRAVEWGLLEGIDDLDRAGCGDARHVLRIKDLHSGLSARGQY